MTAVFDILITLVWSKLYPDEEMIGTFGDILVRSLTFIIYRRSFPKKALPFATVYRRFYYPLRPLYCLNSI